MHEIAANPRSAVPNLCGETKRTILLVEDEDMVRGLLTEVLRRQGYEVIPCADPGEGVAIGTHHPGRIDLLLTDVVMPGMNGREMADQILKSVPELRVIFMSGYAEEVLLQNGKIASTFEYLQKPFTLKTLMAKLSQVFGDPLAPVQ